MKSIAIDRSILAEMDILKTVPCATARTNLEIRGLLNIYNGAAMGRVKVYLLADYGQSLGYNQPANEAEKQKMMDRWAIYHKEMGCLDVTGENPEQVAGSLDQIGVEALITTDTRRCFGELSSLLTARGIPTMNPSVFSEGWQES